MEATSSLRRLPLRRSECSKNACSENMPQLTDRTPKEPNHGIFQAIGRRIGHSASFCIYCQCDVTLADHTVRTKTSYGTKNCTTATAPKPETTRTKIRYKLRGTLGAVVVV
eukprot:3420335-Amphidinium_carterae.1